MIILLIIIASLLLPWMIHTDIYKNELIESLESATGKEVSIGGIGISVRKGIEVYARDISFREPGDTGAHDLFRAKRVGVGIELLPLMKKDVNLTSLTIDSPDIRSVPFLFTLFVPLLASEKGEDKNLIGNIPSSDRKQEITRPAYSSFTLDISGLDTIVLRHGTMTVSKNRSEDVGHPLILHDCFMKIERTEKSLPASVELEASFQGNSGDIQMKGRIGTFDINQGIPMHLLWQINIADASPLADEIGEITGIPVNEGKLNLTAAVEGSFGNELKLSGDGTITDLLLGGATNDQVIGEPLNGNLSYEALMRRGVLDIQMGTFIVGKSEIFFHGSMDLTTEDPHARLTLRGSDLRYNDLIPLFSLVRIHPPSGFSDGFLDCTFTADISRIGSALPIISGNLNLKKFRFMNPLLAAPLEDLGCEIKISTPAVDIQDIQAKLQGERIVGRISFRQFFPPEGTFWFDMFGGDFSGSFQGSTSDRPAFTIDSDISNVNVNLLVAALSSPNKNIIFGDLMGHVHLKTMRIPITQQLDGFQGEIDLQILKGKITTISLLKQIAKVLKAMGGRGVGKDETEFDRIEGRFDIRGGTARTTDFLFRSRDIDFDGSGIFQFDSTVDFNLNASFSREVSKAMVYKTPILKLRLGNDGRISIPLKIKGTFANLEVTIDLNEILKDKKTMDLFQSFREFLK